MKEKILRAVVEEIQMSGMRFTVDDITKRMGISKKTIYEHFASKEEIIQTIIDDILVETDQKTNEIMANQLLTFIEKIKQLMVVLPEYYQIYDRPVLEGMKRYYPDQWQKINDSLEEDWLEIEELVNAAMKHGEVIDTYSIVIIMKVLREAVDTTYDQNFFFKNNITVNQALTEIVDLVLYGMIPEDKR
ncbi:TetR/AcrR family transcriptional regulator [Radiobacillus kanasensis]|uniref:TetR/AcrR family transcriptional regulator n=1 Tax=Radiobacillus kanasensis TaxID=2844358 RepID=UPI001E4D83CD|nr:TetR/AcrR family transcriptional regulator [Radiobacillus kanasensis]UFT99754.1 TetR/AcrR family transcriptional regulator [Radiobacillus kanasensis]